MIDRAPMILPVPAANITTRLGTMDDLPFIDALQKQHSKQLGFFPLAQMEGYLNNGWVRIAEDAGTGERVGYCASRDRYMKRDELGAIFQMCVVPGSQRRLIGASLLKSVFENAAYGCRLYCCWCAQDLAANRFWESMGFVPLAYRAGSEKKSRVHIFWQKRIRSGDTATPWWFPSGTGGGAIREDRIVLPIPPGMHWSEAQALIPPGDTPQQRGLAPPDEPVGKVRLGAPGGVDGPPTRTRRRAKPVEAVTPSRDISQGGLRFGPSPAAIARAVAAAAKPARAKMADRCRPKTDPRLVAAARELRDRWLEQLNASPRVANGKYDVSRSIGGANTDDRPALAASAARRDAAYLPPAA